MMKLIKLHRLHAKLLLITLALVLIAGGIIGCTMKNEIASGNDVICSPDEPNAKEKGDILLDELDPEIEAQVKKDLYTHVIEVYRDSNLTMDDMVLKAYYGTYSGCVIGIWDWPMVSGQMVTTHWVAGLDFIYPNTGTSITVWKDGYLCSLSIAYADGLLTKDDVKMIHDLHNQYRNSKAPLPNSVE